MADAAARAAAARGCRAARSSARPRPLAGVLRDERDAPSSARGERAVRAQADRGVDRLRAGRERDRAARCRRCRRRDRSAWARTSRCARAHYNGGADVASGASAPRRPAGASSGSAGTACRDDLAARSSREFDLGGVIYFARNVVEPAQVAELSREVAALARDWPLWISVDQEGGRVARLKAPFTEWPPVMTLGRSGDEALARALRARAGRRADGRRHQPRLRARARRPHQSRRIR